jgi:hypothetical protein
MDYNYLQVVVCSSDWQDIFLSGPLIHFNSYFYSREGAAQ